MAIKKPPAPPEQIGLGAETPTGFMSLADLQAAEKARAEAIVVSAEQLAEWFGLQRTAMSRHVMTLKEAFEANVVRAGKENWTTDDDRWSAVWLLDARLMYADETLQLLDKRGHVLVCPSHGIKVADAGIDWEGLASRGYVTGEGALAWMRMCERCAMNGPLQTKAKQLEKNWRSK